MSSVENPMRRLLSSLLFSCAIAVFLPFGCAGLGAGCREYCEVETKCCALRHNCSDIADIPTCTATCEKLSKNDAYRQALEDLASCEQGKTCQEVVNGGCIPEP